MAITWRLIADFFQLSYHSFKHSKMRTFLTMVGIFIGIAAVVGLVSLGQGMQTVVAEQFNALGSDKFFIFPGNSMFSGSIGTAKLLDADIEAVKRVRGIDTVAGLIFFGERVGFKNQKKSTFVIGVPTDDSSRVFKSMSTFRVVEGRWPTESERNVAVVGYLLAHDTLMFDHEIAVGDSIEIRGEKFRVIGTMERLGSEQDDTQIYIPLEKAKTLFDTQNYYYLMAKAKPNADVEKVAEETKRKLRNARNVKEGEEDFTVQTPGQLMGVMNNILGVVQAIVVALASISLFVGGIGIMNTMYTSVLERTKEIGIMKAIGARNSHVMTLFLIESGMLGLAGGIIGVLLGVGMGKTVEYVALQYANLKFIATVSPELVGGALLFSFVVGTVSGVMPAKSAAEMNPVEALRYE